jgi:MFS family permease
MVQAPDFNRGVFPGLGVAGGADVVHLYAARAARGFGDGFAAIILPAYLLEIGFAPFQIGLVATAALLGSAATTLAVGLLAPRYGLAAPAQPRQFGGFRTQPGTPR